MSAGRGRIFLLSGEPGIGKTRLAEEMSNEASSRGMRVLWGRCWEGGGAPAYWPLIQILRAAVGDRDSKQLQTLLGPNAAEIAQPIPELKSSISALETPSATTDSESARFLLFDSVATLLKNLARTGPLLVVVDDLHDADQPSLQMLRFIARIIKDVPLLIVGTYRDAEVKNSPELGKLVGDLLREGRPLPLTGLSKAEVGELIASRTGRVVDEGLVADLFRATDGNALYVEGVARLLESDKTAIDRHRFKIPDGVRESIRRQLAALSGEANSLLSIASIIGTEFETRLVERVSQFSAERVVEHIDDAIRIGVLRIAVPGFARQQFAH
ncbi:MAG TPA: AAA family ATPase, partial [Candidatus Binataceae bacterium]|nr:AAA family ATPase [Candidatus Binataceae bacterium]